MANSSLKELKIKIRNLGWSFKSFREMKSTSCVLERNNQLASLHSNTKDKLLRARIIEKNANPDAFFSREILLSINGPVLIDPVFGMVLVNGRCIITEFVARHMDRVVPDLYPKSLFKQVFRTRCVGKIASLRDVHEGNYYHFFANVMPKLLMIEEAFSGEELSLLVGRKLFERRFFQEAVDLMGIKPERLIVQDDKYVRSDSVLSAQSSGLTRNNIKKILNEIKFRPMEKPLEECVIVTRGENDRRNLLNRDEIVGVAESHGFRHVDCSDLSLKEQIRCFANSRFVVAEHGAGLTNMIFRLGHRLDVLEIFPPTYVNLAFYKMCNELHFNHHVIRAKSGNDIEYRIDPREFSKQISYLLKSK